MCYFVQGFTEKAQYFHMRVSQGLIESHTSPLRSIGVSWIKKEVQANKPHTEISSYLLTFLSLPLLDTPIKITPKYRLHYDYSKARLFQVPKLDYLINKVASEEEFRQTINTPRCNYSILSVTRLRSEHSEGCLQAQK